MNISVYKTLLRRELWEHKASVFWTPIGMSGFLLILAIILMIKAAFFYGDSGKLIRFNGNEQQTIAQTLELQAKKPIEARVSESEVVFAVSKAIFDGVVLLLAFYYLLTCMYDERKDRSIYFWRSMPVSDWQTTFSKLGLVAIVLPVIALASLVLLHIAVRVIFSIGLWSFGASAWAILWEPSYFILTAIPLALLNYALAFLWAMPVVGALMFLGATTNRPLVYMILGPAAIMLTEELIFDSSRFANWLGERLTGVGMILWGDIKDFAERQPDFPTISFSQGAELLANEQFWIGLVVGMAFIYGAVYARKRLQEA